MMHQGRYRCENGRAGISIMVRIRHKPHPVEPTWPYGPLCESWYDRQQKAR